MCGREANDEVFVGRLIATALPMYGGYVVNGGDADISERKGIFHTLPIGRYTGVKWLPAHAPPETIFTGNTSSRYRWIPDIEAETLEECF